MTELQQVVRIRTSEIVDAYDASELQTHFKYLLILFSMLATNAVADEVSSAPQMPWILSSSALVLLMTLPGLALF